VAPAGVTHYVHDIFGNIIAETAGGGATGATGTVREYVWLYETEIAPTAGSRTTVDHPLAVVDAVNTASPVTWAVHVDHLNRQVKMTNSAKSVVWSAVWTPWGAPQSLTGSAIPNQSSVAKSFQEFDEAGLMKPSSYYDRVVDVMEELMKYTLLKRDIAPYLTDRYSERVESADMRQRPSPAWAETPRAAPVAAWPVGRDPTRRGGGRPSRSTENSAARCH